MSQIQFEKQFTNNYDALYGFALKLAKNKMDAEDLIQETAFKAYRNFHKYIKNTSFKNWTFTILKNIFITKYRRRKKINQVSVPIEDVVHLINNTEENNQDLLENNIVHLKTNISKLSEKSRVPLKMYLRGFTYEEISDDLEIPMGTVKSRINYAKTNLKKMFNTK